MIDGRSKLLPTPTLGHQLHGMNLFDPKKRTVYVCEGPWDGMALWEIARQAKVADGELRATANPDGSLLAHASVIAVPGCTTFLESWVSLFAGKTVCLMFDSDHPTEKNAIPPGHAGMLRVARLLYSSKTPPAEVKILKWGSGGYDSELPSGYDVRDAVGI
jgi:hypothetical protein